MRVNPYLLFDGNCEEALGAYAKILGGKIVAMMPFAESPMADKTPAEWRKKILHARLEFGDNALMASDAPPGRFQKMHDLAMKSAATTDEGGLNLDTEELGKAQETPDAKSVGTGRGDSSSKKRR